MVRFVTILFAIALCCCVDGLNVILQHPQVIRQMKKIQDNEKISNDRNDHTMKGQACEVVYEKTNYGQGQDQHFLTRDVGKCIKSPISHANLQGPTKVCPSSHVCLPSKANFNAVITIAGPPRTTISATHCQCVHPSTPCKRLPNHRVYHAGTDYEKSVDIGQCHGECHPNKGHKGCKAVSTMTVNINGPNGAQCVQKIIKCACTRGCYRVSHRQTYKTRHFDQSTKTNKTREIVIDIGRCGGGCNDKKRKETCIYWIKQKTYSGKARLVCLFKSGKNSPRECLPRVFKTREITTTNGDKQTINTVKRCGCH